MDQWLHGLRRFLRLMLCVALVAVLSHAASAQDGTNGKAALRVVYHMDDSDRAISALRNVSNHLAASPDTKIVVVALSRGVKFLVDGAEDERGNPYEPMIDDLTLAGVEFRVCNNTLVGFKLNREDLHAESQVVPSGVAEIARLQLREGYAYIKP